MDTVNLRDFPCLGQEKELGLLNRLVKIHDELMPHVIAVATGCSFKEAGALLIFLAVNSLADPMILIYHREHADGPPIISRKLSDGFPEPPFECDTCDAEIEHKEELLYSYSFRLKKDLVFTADS